jgi:hypothetical protein
MELELVPKVLPQVTGNFESYKEMLVKQMEVYKNTPLTEENVPQIKSAIRQMRTSIEKIESSAISVYFDTPKKILKAQFAELYAIIAEGEQKVDAIIAEETRKRNEALTSKFISYIQNKIQGMELEEDVVDFVPLKKHYYNKTAKEPDVLNEIDSDLLTLEKNYRSYKRAKERIAKIADELGSVFNRILYEFQLSKYGDGNDDVALRADEEAERLRNVKLNPTPKVSTKPVTPVEVVVVSWEFESLSKTDLKNTEDIGIVFSVPKKHKKGFNEILKLLKSAGIKVKKN